MDYTCYKESGYRLHIIKTKKFKTITLRIVFRRKVKKEEITIRNVLTDILTQSSKNYPSKRDLNIKAQDLYAASFGTNNARFGAYFSTSFYMSVLNDKYTEEGNFVKCLEFASDVFFNPDVNDGAFRSDKLDLIKSWARNAFASIKDNASKYSLMRLLEEYDKGAITSYRMMGYLEDIEKITEKSLYEYYQSMLKKDLVDIYILGDIDEGSCQELIKNNFKFNTYKEDKKDYIIPCKNKRVTIKKISEKIDNSQSKLVIGARLEDLTDYERRYPLTLFNIILGGESDSKLFTKVREENSLCYTIFSTVNKLDSLMLIRAGIDKENYSKCLRLIKKCLKEMQDGLFSEEDINIAKEYYKTAIDELLEDEARIMSDYYVRDLLGTDPIEERVKKIEKVTKDEIVGVANKVFIDTIFLLEGTNDEKN